MSRKKQKIPLTDLLRNAVKDLRKQYNKRGDTLSSDLQKGASYISQLENGKIKEIEFDLLVDIFQKITELTGVSFNNFICDYINNLLKNMAKRDLPKETWIHLFIMQEIEYPITNAIVDLIKENLSNYNCSPEDLSQKIRSDNLNHLGVEFQYEPNKLFVNVQESTKYEKKNYDVYTSIEYNLPTTFVSQILCKEITTINYINLYGMMYSLFLLKNKNDRHSALVKTEEFLYDNSFFTAIELYDKFHDALENNSEPDDNALFSHYDDLVINYENRFKKLKEDVLNDIEYALDNYFHYGKEATTLYKMEEIRKNMDSITMQGDLGLIMAILASPIYEIDQMDRDVFWNQYKEILNKFFNHHTQ